VPRANAGVGHFYDRAGTTRRERMPAVESLVQKWKAPANGWRQRPGPRLPAEYATEEVKKAINAAGPDSGLMQDLAGPRSPFWVRKRDDAKYLSREAQAALAKLDADLQALRSRTPSLPCANGVREGGLRLSLYPGFQDAPIHVRGSYEQLGQRVPRRAPAVLVKKGSGGSG